MSKNIQSQYFDFQVHIPGIVFSINLKFFTTMVGDVDLTEDSTKNMERDEALIISCRACLFLLFFDGKKRIQHLISLFTFNPWLLDSFDLPGYGSELRKRQTLRLFLMCLEVRNFGSCSVWGGWEINDSLGGKVWLGRARGQRKLCKLTINKLHQRWFPKILPTLHVHFPLAVSWTLYIELHYKKCIFLNMSPKKLSLRTSH